LVENEGLYVGNFIHGTRNGYGVYDETLSGNKYMGMFQDSKRFGNGVYITMDGSYFEGNFVNNVLNGEGLAILPSGIYYGTKNKFFFKIKHFSYYFNFLFQVGELSVEGPAGQGTLYMPESEIIEEVSLCNIIHNFVSYLIKCQEYQITFQIFIQKFYRILIIKFTVNCSNI
jgi:hypothetical protein